ncbi:MAG: outer membrane beta-barrel protein, partial [Bacteroidetes bacterium]|nr:outer membrane beta-barrel protein [Bacteroidota bacterium]
WNVRSFITYGIPLKALKSNINLNLTGNYARIPGQIDEELNHSGNTTLGLGVVLSSNVSDKLDFTISSRSNYNVVNNTLRTAQNDTYFNQRSKVRFNWIFGKNFIFRTEASHQYYGGYSDTFDQQFLLWNLSIGKKLFANQRGELALAVFDLLNQNQSYRRNVTDIYIEDTQTNTLQRYAMIKFTYNMRHFVIQ